MSPSAGGTVIRRSEGGGFHWPEEMEEERIKLDHVDDIWKERKVWALETYGLNDRNWANVVGQLHHSFHRARGAPSRKKKNKEEREPHPIP